MDNNKKMEDIEKILQKANSSQNEEKGSSGFIFEFVPEQEKEQELPSEKNDTPLVVESFEENDVFAAVDKGERIPESSNDDVMSKIWTTYVPRFTEASENYRMKGSSPARASVPKEAEAPKDAKEPSIDPTAEIEENVEGAVVVETSRKADELEGDSINVFKFSEQETEEKQEPERTEQQERAEIESLLTVNYAAEKSEEEYIPQGEAAEPKDYTIPDPDAGFYFHSFEDKEEKKEEAPSGVAEAIPENKKRISSEFTLPVQRDGFKDKFLDSLMSIKIRLGAASVFSLILLLFELMAAFGMFEKTILSFPVTLSARAIIDSIFATCAFAMAIPELLRSQRYMVKERLLPEVMLLMSYVVYISYSLTVISIGTINDYSLYGFMFSIIPLAAISATYFRTEADFTAFKLISSEGEKEILDKKLTRTLPEENIALDGLVDEYKSRTARIFRASFITDFFKRTRKSSEKNGRTLLLSFVPLGISLVCGVIAYFIPMKNEIPIFSATSTFAFIFLVSLPAFALLSRKLPYYDAQRAALTEDSTSVGECAYHDFSEVDVVAFEDTEIFGVDDVNLKRFMLYGERDSMETAIRRMCSLFTAVGGPLKSIFTNSLDTRITHKPASNLEIEFDGLSGDVGGVRIAAGTEEYMLRHGIKIPDGSASGAGGIDTTKIMYASAENEVYAKFYIRYSFSEEFTRLLPALREEGIVPLVYTRDPNISNELLATLTAGADSMRVMKRLDENTEQTVYNRISAGMVTVGDKINAINLILLSKRYSKLSERLYTYELSVMIAGMALSAALSLFGMAASVPALLFGVWQIAWCAVLAILSRNTLKFEKEASEYKEENERKHKKTRK